ncbi:MAG: tyrosine-type recombinase/integrase [Erysipelotrichaceae bacterium]|nr:tyrosine-type recombinase/integrase [Erysipelotrichaceae bacterium]
MYTLKELCDKAFQELLDSGLSYKTVYGANWYIWNRLVRKFGPDEIFKEEMVYEYCIEYFQRDIFSIDRTNLRPVERKYIIAFNNFIQSNRDIPFIQLNMHYHRDFVLDNHSQKLLDEYLNYCKADGNSERTLENKHLRIKNFIIDSDFSNLTKESLIDYLNKRNNDMNRIAYVIEMRLIRRFIVFCYEKGAVDKDILLTFPDNMSSISDKNIPSVYSTEEIKLVLASAKKYLYEDNHLRNYSILCLIAYTGMRANDVANLKLSDIDWRNNEIRYVQQKTKKAHVLPLIPEIGNPMVDYILNERSGSSEYLYTTEKGNKISPQLVTDVIRTYFEISPVEINGRHHGAHALRHSVATNLLNNSVSSFTVANVLGHSNTKCVHIYAKVELNNLRKCVLEAPYYA